MTWLSFQIDIAIWRKKIELLEIDKFFCENYLIFE